MKKQELEKILMFAIIGVTNIDQYHYYYHYDNDQCFDCESKEVIALFTNKQLALNYIEASRLKARKNQKYYFSKKSLLRDWSSIDVIKYEIPINPEIK